MEVVIVKKPIKICMMGFGNVGKEFCRLLLSKKKDIADQFNREILIVGIYSKSKGTLINRKGLDIEAALGLHEYFHKADSLCDDCYECNPLEMIENCEADLFIELSPLSIKDGQPAINYIEKAFDNNMHVITANKGPIAWNFKNLVENAQKKKLMFLYETTVMDGTPIFNLFKECLHGNRVSKITGILNGTSNFVLTQLERGVTIEDAIKEAQAMGLAEADPSMDIDGFDGAAKISALANVVMDANTNPKMVAIESMRSVVMEDLVLAKLAGCKIKYFCEAIKDPITNEINLRVYPKRVNQDDYMSNVNGTSAAITFVTDLAGEITIIQTDPGITQTAYGIYSDLFTIMKSL